MTAIYLNIVVGKYKTLRNEDNFRLNLIKNLETITIKKKNNTEIDKHLSMLSLSP